MKCIPGYTGPMSNTNLRKALMHAPVSNSGSGYIPAYALSSSGVHIQTGIHTSYLVQARPFHVVFAMRSRTRVPSPRAPTACAWTCVPSEMRRQRWSGLKLLSLLVLLLSTRRTESLSALFDVTLLLPFALAGFSDVLPVRLALVFCVTFCCTLSSDFDFVRSS